MDGPCATGKIPVPPGNPGEGRVPLAGPCATGKFPVRGQDRKNPGRVLLTAGWSAAQAGRAGPRDFPPPGFSWPLVAYEVVAACPCGVPPVVSRLNGPFRIAWRCLFVPIRPPPRFIAFSARKIQKNPQKRCNPDLNNLYTFPPLPALQMFDACGSFLFCFEYTL